MAFEADEEILQDFLVEAGEILELLSEQLVDLERNPEDNDLLNAIFRGFHTVKGGAGFLQLDNLVDCCHVAENVFDTLRNGKRSVDAELMDVVLQALDTVNEMFDQVRARQEPDPAEPELLAQLSRLAEPEASEAGADGEAPSGQEAQVAADSTVAATPDEPTKAGDITDDEFEQLLDALEDTDSKAEAKETAAAAGSLEMGSEPATPESDSGDEITQEEFEKLLDELHGKGRFGSVGQQAGANPAQSSADASLPGKDTGSSGKETDSDEIISEDEFEQLLDELHGAGKGPVSSSSAKGSSSSAKDSSGPVSRSESGHETRPKAAHESRPGADARPAGSPNPAPARKAPGKPAKRGSQPGKDALIATETTVRVDTKRLDDIMNMVGELVLVRNRLKRLGDEISDEGMQKAVSNLDVVTGDLQSAVMQTRMQPIKKVFGRFPRVVRDLARSLKKEVNLVLKGEDTDLDKNLVEALSDPLVHLVRNAVDHGVEAPDVREAANKPRTGRVVLSAEQEGDHILLSIEDDGAGMDADVLRRKAVEKGLYDQDAADRLADSECFNLIFAPGFSTKEKISDVSGRGVGMDVVKTKITQLNGQLSIASELGKGSRISIKVPLTLAIMPTLMVMLEDQSFAFPLVSVVEIFHLDISHTNVVDGQECVVVRDKVYPLFHIKKWLVKGSVGQTKSESAHVVIVSVGTKRVGFVVDQLVGQEEVVIKPLGKMLHGTPGMAGATITGDGRIALILDIPSLLQRYA
ncbi:MAG: chemotaxis protein CheA [Gammaproteobacteria bacterium]|nr:MAG: chemotaxis protein CheA [Pseudomonadota bacterium]PIE38087.1 MAG: chemotaxis protein CheA [Gammaproteobacteria bacterium]